MKSAFILKSIFQCSMLVSVLFLSVSGMTYAAGPGNQVGKGGSMAGQGGPVSGQGSSSAGKSTSARTFYFRK
jgi:hypothetical protein